MCQKYILSVYKSNIEFKGGAHAQDRQIRKSAKSTKHTVHGTQKKKTHR